MNHDSPTRNTQSPGETMHTNRATNDLGLTDANAGCQCGHDHGHAAPDATMASSEVVRTHLAVNGMTCGHCVSSVTEELGALDGVKSVDVRLNPGGASQVMVTSDVELDSAAIEAAIVEAGYALAEA
ncbi:MAG TPA: cation transporter [Microbacteriaceae bacterium]